MEFGEYKLALKSADRAREECEKEEKERGGEGREGRGKMMKEIVEEQERMRKDVVEMTEKRGTDAMPYLRSLPVSSSTHTRFKTSISTSAGGGEGGAVGNEVRRSVDDGEWVREAILDMRRRQR